MRNLNVKINLIACVDNNRGIGHEGDLLYKIPMDLSRFRTLTFGETVLMGRGTWDSLPPKNKPLPLRQNVVLSRKGQQNYPGIVKVFDNPGSALSSLEGNVWVIGGEQIYTQFISEADNIFLTKVLASDKWADCFFPKFDVQLFDVETSEVMKHDGIEFQYETYRRKRTSTCLSEQED